MNKHSFFKQVDAATTIASCAGAFAFSCLIPWAIAKMGFKLSLFDVNSSVLVAICVVQGILLAIETFDSAQNGKAISARFGSIWVPIQASLFISWFIPIQSGATLAQTMAMWIVPALKF